jgi:hypothetical protein
LKTHSDTADCTNSKGKGKDLYPELISIHPILLSSGYKSGFEIKQEPTQANADGWKEDVKCDVRCELDSR